jgi:hypothetical protein
MMAQTFHRGQSELTLGTTQKLGRDWMFHVEHRNRRKKAAGHN